MPDVEYETRVHMQESLDELFPRGAYVTVVTELPGSTKLQPTGIELTVGRLFCSEVRELDGITHFKIFIDPRIDELDNGEYVQPFTAWVGSLNDEAHPPTVEARIIPEFEDDPLSVLILRSDPAGPRRVQSGQREFITALREQEFFPSGLVPV